MTVVVEFGFCEKVSKSFQTCKWFPIHHSFTRGQLDVHCDVIKEAENNIVFLLEHPSAPFFLASPGPPFQIANKGFFEGKCTYVWIKRFFSSANGDILHEESGFFSESIQEKSVVKQTSFCCRFDVTQRTMTIVWLNARNIALSTTSQVEIFFIASHDGFLILDWLLLYMTSVSNYNALLAEWFYNIFKNG